MSEILFNNEKKPEYIVCAAIHFNDGNIHEHQPRNIETGFVVCGLRHHNCYMTTYVLRGNESIMNAINEANGKAIQGFLTSKDRFLDRKESAKLAIERNQIEKVTDCLFSEDLY